MLFNSGLFGLAKPTRVKYLSTAFLTGAVNYGNFSPEPLKQKSGEADKSKWQIYQTSKSNDFER